MPFCAAIYSVEKHVIERLGGIVAVLRDGGFVVQPASLPKGVKGLMYAVGRGEKPMISIYVYEGQTWDGHAIPSRYTLDLYYFPSWFNTLLYRADRRAELALDVETLFRKAFGEDVATPCGTVAEGYDANGRRLKTRRPESASLLGMDIILEISVPVVTQVRGDPARAWGIKPGDRLAYIDGHCTRDMTRRELFENLTPNCNRMNVVRGPILIGINCSETYEA